MRFLLIFALLLALSFAISDDASAEPVVFMVAINPSTIDNQVDEQVNFEADCDVCNEEAISKEKLKTHIHCVECSKSFKKMTDLNSHIQQIHANGM